MIQIKINKKGLFLLRLTFLVITISVLSKIVDIRLVLNYLRGIPLYVLASLLVIGVFRTWLSGLRWQLLNPDVSGQMSNWQYFRFMMMAKPFNLIMPGALGGDFVRSAMTVNAVKDKKIDNIIAIIADRFVGLLSILILGTIAFLFAAEIPDRSAFNVFFTAIYLTIAFVIIILTSSYLFQLFEEFTFRLGGIGLFLRNVAEAWKNALQFFKTNIKNVVLGLLLCIPIHVISFITAFLLARSLDIQISFFDISLITALVWLITAIPITISGVGIRELSMVYFFSIYGIDAESATALSIYIYIVSLLLGLLGLLFIIDWNKWVQFITLRLGERQ